MWDWSWLSHRVVGGAFADWAKVTAEASDRGFDTIRFDPLPDLAAGGQVRIAPSDEAVPWVHVPAEQTVDPVAEAVAFAEVAVDAGHRLILSSWGLGRGRHGDTVHFDGYPGFSTIDPVSDVDAYLQGWAVVLDAFADAGLLDDVTYVDVNNELDLVVAFAAAPILALDDRGGVWDWDEVHGHTFRGIAERAITWLHTHYPQLRATVSCCGPIDVVGPWYPRNADVVEWHSWYTEPDRPAWSERVGELLDGEPFVGQKHFRTPQQRARLDAVYRRAHAAADATLRRQQDRYLEAIAAFAHRRGLPAYLGEGYAMPWYSDEPELSWDWIKDVSAAALRTVQRLGFDGYTTSNFSEPTFPLWSDLEWHRLLLA